MENKQTAVQWLFKHARLNMSIYDWLLAIEYAENMEKQQIMDAHLDAYVEMNMSFRGADRAEKYYNETFKQQ